MNREVIQDFLNLAGVIGVALINRRMRPYFYGLDTNLNTHQQQALGQGILQVAENVSDGFKSFEFYYVGNTVFIYKLTHGLVLLVLTDKNLDIKQYRNTISNIKRLIESDTYNAVATLKLIMGNNTQPSLSSWNSQGSKQRLAKKEEDITTIQSTIKPPQISQPSLDTHIKPVSVKSTSAEYKLDELLVAMNKLSSFTTQYLGKVVVANYWKASRPDTVWLSEFAIDRNAQISHPQQKAIACSHEQHHQLQEWAESYIKRCKQVVRNFDNMIVQDCLDTYQQKLLLQKE